MFRRGVRLTIGWSYRGDGFWSYLCSRTKGRDWLCRVNLKRFRVIASFLAAFINLLRLTVVIIMTT